jgi:transposase-like protein
MSIDKDLLDRLMEGRSADDLFGKEGILSELTKALAERALTTEMEEHLGEERAEAPEGQNRPPNRRNGSSQKTVTTDSGKVVLDIPRDRNGTFDPLLIACYPVVFMDAIRVNIRSDGAVSNKAVFVALAILPHGFQSRDRRGRMISGQPLSAGGERAER